MIAPYYTDDLVTLYLGDCREVVPALGPVDCIVTDPPYGSTSLDWDRRWPDGWLDVAARVSNSLWCWLPFRAFSTPPFRGVEFAAAGWRLSQDVEGEWTADHTTWEKPNGTGFAADRFRGVHEVASHWYQGAWSGLRHEVPRIEGEARPTATVGARREINHTGAIAARGYEYGPTRLARSIIRAPSMHGRAIHPTEKPVAVLDPLIRYACPPGGIVLDMFAGSGSTAEAARLADRRAVLVEADEHYCEKIADRLSSILAAVTAPEPAP